MIVHKGYYIEQMVNENKIVIGLPQTVRTFINTIEPVSERRLKLTDEELAMILRIVMQQLEVKEWE